MWESGECSHLQQRAGRLLEPGWQSELLETRGAGTRPAGAKGADLRHLPPVAEPWSVSGYSNYIVHILLVFLKILNCVVKAILGTFSKEKALGAFSGHCELLQSAKAHP